MSHINANNMDDSDSDAECGMSFMFDAASAVCLKRFSYSDGRIVASLNVIDSNPGAVISGHYLWPASEQLCSAVCGALPPSSLATSPSMSSLVSLMCSASSVLELGAGCALAGLVSCQLPPPPAPSPPARGRQVVITDYDPGVLARAQSNRDETLKFLLSSSSSSPSAPSSLASLEDAQFHPLSWGVASDVSSIKSILGLPSFDIVVGCDVVYCKEVVEPLFKTAALLLDDREGTGDLENPRATRGAMIMSQSFVYDSAAEVDIDRCCRVYGFERLLIWSQDKDETAGKAFGKIQVFSATKM